MTTLTHDLLKDKNISHRIDSQSLDIISMAAKFKGISRSAFMVSVARKEAENILLEQNNFFLTEEKWKEINKLLDQTPQENKRLQKLLKANLPW